MFDDIENTGKLWWRKLKECDPITIEPLSELPYPPFPLETNGVKVWFDGQTLAHYIVSTGTFLNPMTRHELTREDCIRLDKYIRRYNLKEARVRDAFEIRHMINNGKEESERGERLRREATVVFHSLFDFSSYEDRKRKRLQQNLKRKESHQPSPPPPPSLGTSKRYLVHNEGGITVFDDDEWTADVSTKFITEFPQLPEIGRPQAAMRKFEGRGRGRGKVNGNATKRELNEFAVGATEPVSINDDESIQGDTNSDGSKDIDDTVDKSRKVSSSTTESDNQLYSGVQKQDHLSSERERLQHTDREAYEKALHKLKLEKKRDRHKRKFQAGAKIARQQQVKLLQKKEKNKINEENGVVNKQEKSNHFSVQQAKENWDVFYGQEMARRRRRKVTLRIVALVQVCLLVVGIKILFPSELGFVYSMVICLFYAGVSLFVLVLLAKKNDATRPYRSVRHFEGGASWNVGDRIGITIIAIGTRGDVQPLVAIAKELQHHLTNVDVLMCAPSAFKFLIQGNGIMFASCGVERFEATSEWADARTSAEFMRVAAGQFMKQYDVVADACWKACTKPDMTNNGMSQKRMHRTDVILCGHFGLQFGLDIAEALDTPCWGLKFKPDTKTSTRPPFGVEPWYPWMSNVSVFNQLLYFKELMSAVKAANNLKITKHQNNFRKKLGLPPLTGDRLEEGSTYLPTIYGFSQHVFPVPKDWPTWHKVSGYWFLNDSNVSQKSKPDIEIETLLTPYDITYRPICITLGSMTELTIDKEGQSNHKWTTLLDKIVEAAHQIKPRRKCIILTGNTKLEKTFGKGAHDNRKGSNTIVLSDFPHEKLFPYCSVIVHHGGAGTTARCLYAGVPSVVVPILRWYDQGGWGIIIESLGAGSCVMDVSAPVSEFASVLHRTLSTKEYKKNVQRIGKAIRSDNGTQCVVDTLIQQLRPKQGGNVTSSFQRMAERHCLHRRFNGQFK